jgi:hypothetical protein
VGLSASQFVANVWTMSWCSVNDTCDACYPHMRATTIARDHTDHSTRIRHCNEQSNKSVPLSSPPILGGLHHQYVRI